MLHLELEHHHLYQAKEQGQLTQANYRLQKLQEHLAEQMLVLLEEMKAFEAKVEANAASEPEPMRRRFSELKDQISILSQNLDLLLSA